MTSFARLRSAAFVAVVAAAAASPVIAVPISGSGALGDFSGTLTYTAGNMTTGTLTVVLTNETTTAAGGKITAFVLNNPGDLITSISSFSFSDTDFGLLGLTDDGINAQPFGDFDFGASLGGSFQGGGSPNPGIHVGGTATFTFTLTGTNMTSLSDASFLSALSSPRGNDEGLSAMVVRFRGFNNGGSDKVTIDIIPPVPTPEPAALALLGLGILGIAGARRRRR